MLKISRSLEELFRHSWKSCNTLNGLEREEGINRLGSLERGILEVGTEDLLEVHQMLLLGINKSLPSFQDYSGWGRTHKPCSLILLLDSILLLLT